VAKHPEASGPLALSRRPRDTAHPLIGSTAFSATSVLPHSPAQPAEIAQARVFEALPTALGLKIPNRLRSGRRSAPASTKSIVCYARCEGGSRTPRQTVTVNQRELGGQSSSRISAISGQDATPSRVI
jgi:hypothetical protein